MGDMGDFWRDVREAKRQRKQQAITKAMAQANEQSILPWTRHTEYHWSLDVCGHRLDYWPSTEHFRYLGKSHHGDITAVEGFVRNLEKDLER